MDAAVAGSAAPPRPPTQLTFQDGLGQRRFEVGPRQEPLEVLSVNPLLTEVSSFHFALRERAARLSSFRHDSYARVHSVELDRETGLLRVISDYTAGTRLSSILAGIEGRPLFIDVSIARCVIRQLASAAAALQAAAPDVANGALAPGRVVVTPSGQAVIVEYVLGSALEQLGYTRARYWSELGVALPSTSDTLKFDLRADVTQLGVIALALILGRPLTTDEYPDRLADLVHRSSIRTGRGFQPMPPPLRDWLARALQLDRRTSFESPADAQRALDLMLGSQDVVAEHEALRVFLTRFAAHEALPAEALGPRLEAMKAFLERYPSQRAEASSPSPTVGHDDWGDSFAPDTGVVSPTRTTEAAAAGHDAGVAELGYAEDRRVAMPLRTSGRAARFILLAVALAVVALAVAAVLYSSKSGIAQVGSVSVTSTPPGIPVFVDDVSYGVTPLGIELPPGEHVLELRANNGRRQIPITVTAGSQLSQYFEFTPAAQNTAATLTGAPSTAAVSTEETPPRAGAGSLVVRTEPETAAVIVDGEYVGRSPIRVPGLTAGEHTVVVEHESGTLTERVLVESGSTASLIVSMGGRSTGKPSSAARTEKPATAAPPTAPTPPTRSTAAGSIRLEVAGDVQVLENGRLIGSSHLERIMLPVGRHELDFVNDALGFKEQRVVQVAAGQVTTVKLDWPQRGLAVNASPWADVFLNGNRLGETPIGKVIVPIGRHELVFRHPDLGERRMPVMVGTGSELVRVSIDMRTK